MLKTQKKLGRKQRTRYMKENVIKAAVFVGKISRDYCSDWANIMELS